MRKPLPDGDAAVEHGTEEHKELERTLKRLEGTDPGRAPASTRSSPSSTTLADHLTDEKSEQSPRLRQSIPREELVNLASTHP